MKMWIGNLDGIRQGLAVSSPVGRARRVVRASYVAGDPRSWVEDLCEMLKRRRR